MGFRRPIRTASALDTRSTAAPAGVQVYVAPNPDGTGTAKGIVEWDDGNAGDVPVRAVQAVAGPSGPRSQTDPYGRWTVQGGSYAAGGSQVAAPSLSLGVEQDGSGFPYSEARITGARRLRVGSVDSFGMVARCERDSSAGPVNSGGRVSLAWDSGSSPTFTLDTSSRVLFVVRTKASVSATPGVARLYVILAAGTSTPPTGDANVVGMYDDVMTSTYPPTLTFECDALMGAGTYTMGLALEAPVTGQSMSLIYEATSPAGYGPRSCTTLTARVIGHS